MRAGAYALLLAAFGLSGCDRITGEADRKTYDAEAIGYACRVSLKVPEDCMKENDGHSPTYVLNGWKKANKDIEDNVIDPTMGKHQAPPATPVTPVVLPPQSAPAAAETADKAASAKPVAKDKKPAAPLKGEKPTTKNDKPAPAKPDATDTRKSPTG